MLAWLKVHAWWLAICSILFSVAVGLVGLGLLMRLPEDYFLRDPDDAPGPAVRHPGRVVLVILKNVLGGAIVILGAAMSLPLVPGPGVVMIILGLSLMNFPGKRKLELRLLKIPLALEAVNWTRRRRGRAPFQLPS
jgi:hypothetical protein